MSLSAREKRHCRNNTGSRGMLVPEWTLLSGRKTETSCKCQWWYLIKGLRSTGKECFRTKRVFVFIFRNISGCNSLRVVPLNVWSFLLSECYLFIVSDSAWSNWACTWFRDRQGSPMPGEWLQGLWPGVASWMWTVFLPWDWKKGSDSETDWKLRGKGDLVTFWCMVLQTRSSVPWV